MSTTTDNLRSLADALDRLQITPDEALSRLEKIDGVIVNQDKRAAELVKALEEARQCIDDIGSGRGGWAWEEVLSHIDSALSAYRGEGK